MKKRSISIQALWLGVVMLAGVALADDVRVGDSREDVLRALGEPRGQMKYEDSALFFYDRGRVEFEEGRVVLVKLISEEALRMQREEEAEARERAAVHRARRLAESYAEGRALRKAKLADERFMRSSAQERVAYWRTFRERYPNVPIGDAYTLALEELQTEMVERTRQYEQDQRVERLERRVRNAEDAAYRAEARANRSRGTYVGLGYSTYYPVYSYNRHVPYRTCKTRPARKAYPSSSGYRYPRALSSPVHRTPKPCATPYYGRSRHVSSRSGVRVSASYRGGTSYARAGLHF